MIGHATLKLLLLTSLLVVAGLLAFLRRDEDTIRSYTVRRPPPRDRMLAAIILRGDQAWFFKLAGAYADAESQADSFRQLIRSVRFDESPAAPPRWTLPAGWTQRPGNQMRYATLEVGTGKSRLECSVSSLPVTGAERREYLLANINRWRGQMRLPRVNVEDLESVSETILLSDGSLAATLVDLAGEMSGTGTGSMPPAVGGAGLPGTSANTGQERLTYDVPEGWQQGAAEVSRGGITVRRSAAFEVRQGEQVAEITVTRLKAGGMLDNVNRWRGQIGLAAMTLDQFEQARQSIEMDGYPADYVQFFGAREAILGVMAARGETMWFVKLQGPAELAGRERQHFEEFVQSIRIE
jgi:hypothetical protein